MPHPEQPMQENLADIKEPQQQKAEGLEIAKTPESERVIESANNLAGKIERDEKVTAGEVYDLRETLGQMKFDFYGNNLTIKEIRQDPNIQKNIGIWQEIESGNWRNREKLTMLPPKIARAFKNVPGDDVYLNNLSSLQPESVKAIKDWEKVRFLHLDGISNISKDVATALAAWHGENLHLRGLTTISQEEAKALKDWSGTRLYLSGLISISDEAAEELKKFSGFIDCPDEIQKQIYGISLVRRRIPMR
ncbi:MAG: hypothetical protein WC663_02385 [Patescibacteria group bacterium]|jgi:hypothetical protein